MSVEELVHNHDDHRYIYIPAMTRVGSITYFPEQYKL